MVHHMYSFSGGFNTNILAIKETDISADMYPRSRIYSTKKAVEEAVMLIYHLWCMIMKANKPLTIFVDNISAVLNANNPGI